MRKRNKKKKKNNAFLFPVPIAGLVIVSVTVGLVYVGLGCRCQALGQELKGLEEQRAELNRQYQQELFKWTRLKAPQNLDRALASHGIAMSWPSSRQVVRLDEHDLVADPWDINQGARYARLERMQQHE
ncbi:MAG: hypothetical protein O3A51_14520 [Verrucomicrobia bacterium]|nr:hypothetical protein [Verrucomicrobiota bacterium]